MSVRRVIWSVLLCVVTVTTAVADIFLYVVDEPSDVSLSGPRMLIVATGYEIPRSMTLEYDRTFGQRGYRLDKVDGDSAVAANLLKHIDVSSGLRKPTVRLKRLSQSQSFEMQPDELRPPNAFMVVTEEVCYLETPVGEGLTNEDPHFARADDSYEFAFGVRPIHDSDSVDVDPTFDRRQLAHFLVFPDIARRNGIEGQVTVDAMITPDGTVYAAIVSKTDHTVFNEHAVRAVLLTQFTPAMMNGKPVPIWVRTPIMFALR